MKSKIFTTVFSLILVVLFMSFVSGVELTGTGSTTLTQFNTQKTITLNTNTNSNISVATDSKTLTQGSNQVTLTINPSEKNNVSSADFNINASGDLDKFEVGTYSKIFTFTATNYSNSSDTDSKNVTVNFERSFCDYKNIDDMLEIDNIDFSVEEGLGDGGDKFFYSLDQVELEFDIDNDGSYDVDDLEIEACFYDEDEGECILDEDDMDLSDDSFNLDEGDDKTITANFDLDPDDLNEGNTDYKLLLRASGEIDDSDSPDDGNNTCVSETEDDLEIRTDEEFVVVSNILMEESLTCGQDFQLSADIWNIGDEDIDEDDIFINIYNNQLGINENIDFTDVDSFDMEKLEKTLSIPEDVEEKTYSLKIKVFDDEDMSSDDIYENSENDEAVFTKIFNVANCIGERNASITASLESEPEEVKAGNTIKIQATLTNTGEETTNYILQLIGQEKFSQVKNITPSTFNLQPGQSQTSTINLELDEDSEGTKQFDIRATFGDKTVDQTVELTIAPGFQFPDLGDNWFIWVIVAVNAILIIAIIIVAIRMSGTSRE